MTFGDEAEFRHWLVDYLVTNIGCNPNDIDLDLALNDLGVGSRDAVVLSGELSEVLGRPVSPVDFWQHPTINALAAFLISPQPEPDLALSGLRGVSRDEPIAVIGLGCRFPGGIDRPEALWRFLIDGGSAVGEVPPERWRPFDDGSPEVAAALASTTRWGSFLSEIDAFDAEFFDISPSEAAKVDPQQRLLLEVAWDALEHAGIPADSLRRTQTGVFAGACVSEYGYLAFSDLSQVDAWTNTGGALSIIANRLSYFLDLRGPSVAVDTACSSSLVAVHLACESLRMGDSDLAIAAGVNLLLSPAIFRGFDQANALSATGQCHAFDAGADGFVRGEGCGVVVLKRLSDALRDGDRMLAVVRGSAVNQDGRSNGLMAPNPAAQMAVLRAACANARVQPREVDYVEAHGTGTLLGDPIEARALGAVLGRGRPESSPLLIGAIKSNLGHLEAAAGVAGFIKAVLAVQRGHIPPNLHFETPNPHIPFQDLRLKVVAEPTDWPATGFPRRAGVSSFGFGGTNAHVVVEQGPDPVPVSVGGPGSAVSTLVVSGKTPERVASWAAVLAEWMDGAGAGVGLADVAHTVNHHRARQAKFATVCARDHAQAVAGLRALAAGQAATGLVGPHEGPCGPGTVFVYSGQGSQWPGMGQRLLADEPAFAAAVAELEPDFVAATGFSLRQVLADGEPVAGIDRIQPVLVGVQLALTALWRFYGVQPDAVIGHSMGEVTAAVVAGALSVADGLRVIATRSKLMARLSGRGAMALLELDPAGTQALIEAYPEVTLAVYASPRQTVIAGPPEQIDTLIDAVQQQDRLARRVEVDVASHHRIIDPILPELRSALAGLAPAAPSIPIITTTYDHTHPTPVFDADYWAANLRNPVRFSQAIATAGADHHTFIEISPHPLLTHAITDTLAGTHHHSLATLQRDTHDTHTFHTNLNTTHTTRPPQTPHPPEPHPSIPTTPWHHTHHWISTTGRAREAGSAPRAGTLLGEHITVSSIPPAHLWQARLVPEAKPYPGYHRIHGVEVVPVSVLLQTILTAAAEVGASALSKIRFEHPVVADQPRVIQVVADHESISLASSSAADAPADRWIRHVTAQLSPFLSEWDWVATLNDIYDGNGHRHEIAHPATSSIDELLRLRGIDGRPFGWSVDSCTSTSKGMVAAIGLPEASTLALLDAAVHVAPLVDMTDSRLYVPASVEHVRLEHAVVEPHGSVSVRQVDGDEDEVIVDVTIAAGNGGTCISMRSLRYAALEPGSVRMGHPDGDARRFAHTIEWQPWQDSGAAKSPAPGPRTFAVIGGDGRGNDELRRRLEDAGFPSSGLAGARYVLYVAEADLADDAETDFGCAVRMSTQVTRLVRMLAELNPHNPAALWIVTRGVHEAVDAAAVRQSCLWGLAGVIASEHPELWGGLVDIDPGSEAADCVPALARVLGTRSKTVLVLRDDIFLVPVLAPVTGKPVRDALRCRPDAAYLITGGMGALGLLMAAWLADRGARRLVLAARTPLPPRRDWDRNITNSEVLQKITAIRALEMRGISVEVVALDIGCQEDVQAMLAKRDRDGAPPIRGIIHAAGVLHNQLMNEMTDGPIRQVLWPKVSGGHVLHKAFPPGSVDFFFLTASAGAMFGIPGQGSYAAANAYLDALARARHRQGCHTLSLDWVAWRGLGFASDAHIVVQELQRLGSREITPGEAFSAWEHVDTYDVAQAVVMPVPSPVGEDRSIVPDVHLSSAGVRAWSQMSATDLHDALENGIRTIIARELRLPKAELDTDRPFAELGLNSMMALSIRRETEQLVGIELSATMLWNHPTVASLTEYLAKMLAPQAESEADDVAVPPGSVGSVLNSLFDRIESAPAGTET